MRITRSLRIRGPIVFAGAYLLCIPLFAALYTYTAPSGFYAPFAKYEPARYDDQRRIENELEQMICPIALEPTDLRQKKDLDAGDPFCDVTISEVDIDKIVFHFHYGIAHGNFIEVVNPGDYIIHAYFTELYHKDGTRSPTYEIQKYNDDCVGVEIEDLEVGPGLAEKIQSKLGAGCGASKVDKWFSFSVHNDLIEHMEKLIEGVNGSSDSIGSNYFRMLYFSTITIATIGYGDIVPLTPWARFLVALEALFGLTFAGLFLNSLYERLR